jgi:hypothetical protein
MTRLALIAALCLAAPAAWGQSAETSHFDLKNWVAPISGPVNLEPACVSIPGLTICAGAPPTIKMDPKMEPRDVARRFLEAMVRLGFHEQ